MRITRTAASIIAKANAEPPMYAQSVPVIASDQEPPRRLRPEITGGILREANSRERGTRSCVRDGRAFLASGEEITEGGGGAHTPLALQPAAIGAHRLPNHLEWH